jgi:hypothetical protein
MRCVKIQMDVRCFELRGVCKAPQTRYGISEVTMGTTMMTEAMSIIHELIRVMIPRYVMESDR